MTLIGRLAFKNTLSIQFLGGDTMAGVNKQSGIRTRVKIQPNTFIIRIWDDRVSDDGSVDQWHGSIDHVGSSHHLYFYNLESISGFIREQAGLEGDPKYHWWQSLISALISIFTPRLKSGKDGITESD